MRGDDLERRVENDVISQREITDDEAARLALVARTRDIYSVHQRELDEVGAAQSGIELSRRNT